MSAVTLLLAAIAASAGVRGVVLDAETSAPASGATVKLSDGRSVATDEAGAFSFDEVKPGPQRLEASAAGYDTVAHALVAPETGEVNLMLAIGKKVLPGDIVGVAVYRPATGPPLPIAGAVISVPGRPVLKTDAEGKFRIEKIGPGPVSFKIRAAGYKPSEETAIIPSGGQSDIEVALTAANDSLAILRGQVRTSVGGPVKATLKVLEAKLTAQTKDDGSFMVRVNAGRYRVAFEAPGFTTQTRVVEIAPGDQALFYVDLSPER